MVTYGDMFAYTLVLIGIVGLCVQIAQFRNKKKYPPRSHTQAVTSVTKVEGPPVLPAAPYSYLYYTLPDARCQVREKFYFCGLERGNKL